MKSTTCILNRSEKTPIKIKLGEREIEICCNSKINPTLKNGVEYIEVYNENVVFWKGMIPTGTTLPVIIDPDLKMVIFNMKKLTNIMPSYQNFDNQCNTVDESCITFGFGGIFIFIFIIFFIIFFFRNL